MRLRGIGLGRAVDVIVDIESMRALGLDVLCKDDEHRFLPLTAAVVGEDEIGVASSLTLLAADELAFYRRRARTLRELRGAAVTSRGAELGAVSDLLVSPDGALVAVVLADGRRVAVDDGLQILAEPRRVDAA